MTTTPVTLLDEHFIHADSVRCPMSVHIEIRVSGSIDVGQLRSAIRIAAGKHPIARARLVPAQRGSKTLNWEILPELQFEPLTVLRAENSQQLQRAREQLVSVSVPLDTAPPFRLYLVHYEGGDYLILNVSHAAADGLGSTRLMYSILRAYAGLSDRDGGIDSIGVRNIPATLKLEGNGQRRKRLTNLVRETSQFTRKVTPIAPQGASGKAGYGLFYLNLDPHEVGQLNAKRHVPASINDLLVAALHMSLDTWNRDRGVAAGNHRIMIPVNLRPREWWYEVFCNYSSSFHISTRPDQRKTPGGLMNDIFRQTSVAKDKGFAASFLEPLALGAQLPLWLKKRLIPALDSSPLINGVLSNVGKLKESFSLGDAGEVTEFWFSPPMFMSDGMAMGASGYQGSFHLCFRYLHSLMSADAVSEFVAIYRKSLHWLSN